MILAEAQVPLSRGGSAVGAVPCRPPWINIACGLPPDCFLEVNLLVWSRLASMTGTSVGFCFSVPSEKVDSSKEHKSSDPNDPETPPLLSLVSLTHSRDL